MRTGEGEVSRGRKLVVQMVETFGPGGAPRFVESLDAVQVGADAGLPLAPVMVYGDDVTHVVTEEGVAYLYRARNLRERREALAAVAEVSPIGRRHDRPRTSGCARLGSWPSPRTSAFGARTPGARCSRRTPSGTSSNGPGLCKPRTVSGAREPRRAGAR